MEMAVGPAKLPLGSVAELSTQSCEAPSWERSRTARPVLPLRLLRTRSRMGKAGICRIELLPLKNNLIQYQSLDIFSNIFHPPSHIFHHTTRAALTGPDDHLHSGGQAAYRGGALPVNEGARFTQRKELSLCEFPRAIVAVGARQTLTMHC